jgi:hypothetical protein
VYGELIARQLLQDLLLIAVSLALMAWGYWMPLPGLARGRGAAIRALGRLMMALMAVAVIILAFDAYQTYQDLRLGGPETVSGRVTAKDVRPLPFRRKGAITLDPSPLRFALDLDRLEDIAVGDRISLEYAPNSRTVLRIDKLP